MFKKISFAVIGLAISSLVNAGSMGPVCTPGDVTVPCAAQAWEFGVQAFYLRPTFSSQNSVTSLIGLFPTIFNGIPVSSKGIIRNDLQNINNPWDWGSRLWGVYHFDTGNDITVSWLYFRGDTDFSWIEGISRVGFSPSRMIAPSKRNRTVTVDLAQQNRVDQVTIELGQHVDVGLVKKLRFYGGLQYAHLQVNSTDGITPNFPLKTYSTSLQFLTASAYNNNDYKGWGPVVGLDYAYNLTEAFSVTAKGAGSILYGTNRYITGVTALLGTPPEPFGFRVGAMVPSLEAKLGVNYGYNMAQGQLNLQVGYEALNFFKVISSQPTGAFIISRLKISNGPIAVSNYGLYGPYLSLSYVGNA